ncbi:MerR family transcriptional regulator [Actinoplanes couchii]|uniref:MerR family transcriptional regulator n=1 Tax=Actinoplanes couchii TaxID=403638 RepID=A0ABQ3XKL0_9ACTN|nr:MerR family transcriptional regulator [Actinoplanes couchii]MDR6319575.1 DNA-binding transcriptional MerR regulator [Actinoplanes couchii]GID59035.1 MerR family transcriptional regulator [Actinoplanes couchii]
MLTIQEVARRTGFSEPTLRYYEKIGLIGGVDRDPASGHRRYGPAALSRADTLACLRSSGMTLDGMRRYATLAARGDSAAGELRELFTEQAGLLAEQVEQLRLRQEYLSGKADLWQARTEGDRAREATAVQRVEKILRSF